MGYIIQEGIHCIEKILDTNTICYYINRALDKAVEFYRDVLGATDITEPKPLPPQGVSYALVNLPTGQIELGTRPAGRTMPARVVSPVREPHAVFRSSRPSRDPRREREQTEKFAFPRAETRTARYHSKRTRSVRV